MEKAATIFSNGKGGKSSDKLPQIARTGTPLGVLFATPIGAFPARLCESSLPSPTITRSAFTTF